MTNTRDDLVLSGIELVVLARLSSPKPPEPRDLTDAVRKLALLAESTSRIRDAVNSTLAVLQQRALVIEAPATPRGRAAAASASAAPPRRTGITSRRWVLTDDGGRALRAAFQLGHTPTWREVRDAHLPALGLGLRPDSEESRKTLETRETITTAVLRTHLGIAKAPTLRDICDALIAEALGLPPGPVTLARIQYHILARRGGVEPKHQPKHGELEQMAARIAAATLRERRADKRSMLQALGRRWIYKVTSPQRTGPVQPNHLVQPVPPASAAPAVQPALPASPSAPVNPARPPSSSRPTSSLPTSPPSKIQPISADTLLSMVREAIPKVGADGRFGPDKVYVSAIWRSIERDGRLLDLSLDRFKRWLVIANRDRLLDLARADLVGAMDAHLVAESEIEHLGSTFHFVLDHQAVTPGAERRSHAR